MHGGVAPAFAETDPLSGDGRDILLSGTGNAPDPVASIRRPCRGNTRANMGDKMRREVEIDVPRRHHPTGSPAS
jgi:hypothetical protein